MVLTGCRLVGKFATCDEGGRFKGRIMRDVYTGKGHYFREWRKYKNLTLQEVADRMEMTPSHLSMLERGERGYNPDTLKRLAAALRVDIGTLLLCNPREPIWPVWARAKPSQKAKILQAAINLLKKG
jgi:transcriptional regulator with XRE-family HTH domain